MQDYIIQYPYIDIDSDQLSTNYQNNRRTKMLILTRCVGEKIIINGGEIEIVALSTNGNRISLGVKAHNSISIDREEVFHKRISKK